MKALAHRLYSSPGYAKAVYFGKLITITGSAQLLVQGFGFFSGIIIIRLLSTQEYAWYTLANSMLGMMIMLSDSGIANGVMAEGGKVWQDKKQMGSVLATGLKLRNKFGVISLIVALPILIYLLLEHGANWLTTGFILLAIIPAFFAALSDSLLEIVPKLHQDINRLQKNQVQVGAGRLMLSASLLFFFPFTYIALFASSIPRIYGNYQLAKLSSRFASNNEKPDPVVEKKVFKSVRRTLPIVIYYCISGQISIWLISFFGTTANISEIGALGRLAMIFNLFTIIFSTLVVPRFSRMNASKNILLKPFLLIQAGTILISILLLLSIWLFSNQILWVLGKNYYGLNNELLLIAISNGIGLISGVCGQLVLSRGWFLRPYFLIGVNFISTAFGIAFLNISSLKGILYFNIIIAITSYILVLVYGLIQINKTASTDP